MNIVICGAGVIGTAIAYALVLGIGIAANDLVTYVNEPISMDSQDAVAWVEQYLGDS